ncbi:MAG TPA: DUF4149 domain-containing protein [Isosphaeraceae bacterium]|jgi:hypothetical protein|nr:DUF4149 domain-containing protein [Isosphaeraceae bacterium]
MSWRLLSLRFLCLASLAVWVGGFTFYGAFVIPILHDEMESLQAGGITQRVTDVLNAVGAATLAVWWFAAWVERSVGSRATRRARVLLLITTSTILTFLCWLHIVMDHKLENAELSSFYPLHRAYLIASTIQWGVNLGLLLVSLMLWCAPMRLKNETPR